MQPGPCPDVASLLSVILPLFLATGSPRHGLHRWRQCLSAGACGGLRKLLRAGVGPAQDTHPAIARQSRLLHRRRRAVLRVLRRLRRAVQHRLLQLQPWRVAHRVAQQQHPRPGRIRPGAVAAGRPRGEPDAVHARLLAPSALQLGPAWQRPKDARCLSGAVRRRRGRRHHRPRSRLRAVSSAERRRGGGPGRPTRCWTTPCLDRVLSITGLEGDVARFLDRDVACRPDGCTVSEEQVSNRIDGELRCRLIDGRHWNELLHRGGATGVDKKCDQADCLRSPKRGSSRPASVSAGRGGWEGYARGGASRRWLLNNHLPVYLITKYPRPREPGEGGMGGANGAECPTAR